MIRGHFPSRRRGFTLVELLVVVGIIAMLVAFLLPVLRRVRDQAALVADLSGIRQCGLVAITMYANDNKGQVTPLIGVRAGFPGTLGFLLTGPGGGWAISTNLSPSWNPFNCTFADLMQPYLAPHNQRDQPAFREYSGVFYCAADWVGMDGLTWGGGRPGWWANGYQVREFSWRMNYNVTPLYFDYALGRPMPKFGRKVSSIRNPSAKVLLAESHYEAVHGDRWAVVNINGAGWSAGILTPDAANRNSRWSPPRHQRGFVASYCDGHAEIIPFGEWKKFCDDYPNGNWAVAGWGPNWDLDKP